MTKRGLSLSLGSPNHIALSAGYRPVGYTALFEVPPEEVIRSVGMDNFLKRKGQWEEETSM